MEVQAWKSTDIRTRENGIGDTNTKVIKTQEREKGGKGQTLRKGTSRERQKEWLKRQQKIKEKRQREEREEEEEKNTF